MRTNELKKAKAEKAWELATLLVNSMELDDLDAFNNFNNLSKDERSMVIFLTGRVMRPTIGNGATCLLLFEPMQKKLLLQIMELADNVVISSVEGQVRFMFGFMDILS